MKKKLVITVLLILIGTNIFSFVIPVHDREALEKLIKDWIDKKIGEFGKMNTKQEKFEAYFDEFKNLMSKSARTWAGFWIKEPPANEIFKGVLWSSQAEILVDLKGLEEAISVIADLDKDTWKNIFKDIDPGSIEFQNKYKNVSNYDYARNTEIYKRSPIVQKQIENQISINNKLIERQKEKIKYLKVVMNDEKELSKRMNEFDKKLISSGTEKTFVGDIHGILYLNAMIRYETMRARTHILAMARLLMEDEIVQRITETDDLLRKAREDAAAFEANIKK